MQKAKGQQLFTLTTVEEKYAANNALAKYGAGQTNIGCSSLSALVWGWTLSKKLFVNFIIIFLFSIATGQDKH